jgi:protein-S-isoprenylcysteine O-methyltransferase Ste14
MRGRIDDIIFPIAAISLIICWLLFIFFFHNPASFILFICGNITIGIAVIIIILAMRTLRKRGRLQDETDFTATTSLVTEGIYAYVRHPLYLGWMLTYPAAMLVAQHWLVVIFGVIGVVSMVRIVIVADSRLVDKFGSQYEDYMHEVPRLNLILGIMRKLQR